MVTMKGPSFFSGIGPHSLPYPAYLCYYPRLYRLLHDVVETFQSIKVVPTIT
jgi:hypothetical protein